MADIESKAINTLLGVGIKFKISIGILGFIVKIPFRIKPLYLGTILHLSKQRLAIRQVSEDAELVWEVFDKADNLNAFAKCIAISALNNPIKIRLFTKPLSRLFLSKLSVEDAHNLMTVVVSQMNAKGFFLTTALVKGIQIVDRRKKKNPDISRKKQYGEQSEKSQKN